MLKDIIKAALTVAAISTGAAFLTGGYVKGMFLKEFAKFAFVIGLNAITAKGANNTSGKNLGIKQAGLNSIAPRNILYGKNRVGGTIVYRSVSGNSNTKLHNVIALAGHEINDLKKLYIDGGKGLVELDLSSDFTTATENGETVYRVTNTAFTNTDNPEAYTGGSLIKLTFEKGDQTTSNGYAVNQIGANWTTDHKLQGIAYVYINCIYDAEKFASYPNFSFEVEGKKVYDPVTTTTAYSTNPALIIRDYLMDSTYGFGAVSSEINDATTGAGFVKARSDCNDSVSITGGTESRYTLNGQFDSTEEPQQVLQHMLSACAGQLLYNNGKFSLFVGKERTASGTITDDKLLAPISITTKASGQDLANGVKATYVRPSDNYIAAEITPYQDSTYLTADTPSGEQSADYENYMDLSFPYTQSTFTAQRLARISLDYQRQDQTLTAIVPLEFMTHQVGDIINFTNDRLGYSGKDFEIVAMGFEFIGDNYLALRLNLKEYAGSVFNNITYVADPTLPSAPSAGDNSVGTPTGLTLTEASKNTTAKEIYVKASWTNDDDDKIVATEVAFKKSTDSDFSSNYTSYPRTTFTFRAESSTTYNFKVRHISSTGVAGDYTGVENITTSADVGTFTSGTIAGITVATDKLYEGTGTFNNSNTGFYLDNTGQFSLKDKLSFDGTTLNISGNLTVENTITADKILLDGINLDDVISASTVGTDKKLTATLGEFTELTVLNELFLQGEVQMNSVEIITQNRELQNFVSLELDSNTPATTTNKLYQASGTLYWNGNQVGVGAINSVTNMVDNRVLTASGSNSANGEANLTFDGSTLDVNGNINITEFIKHRGDNDTYLQFTDDDISLFAGGVEFISMNEAGSDTITLHQNTTASGNLIVSGDLTVNGTTTTLNTATLDVEDKNITLNYSTGDSSASANGAGITIQDAVNSTTDATILWDATNDEFDFSHGINISGNSTFNNSLTVEGTTTFNDDVFFSNDALFGDSDKAIFGASSDLQIYHDGSNSYIQDAGTGNLYIEGTNLILRAADDSRYLQAVDVASGYTALYHPATDGQKLATTAGGVSVTGTVDATGTITVTGASNNIRVGTDTGKFLAGASNDLQIYHDGSHSYISDSGTGSLRVTTDAFRVRNAANNASVITGLDGGGVFLYHNGNEILETTSSGVEVTGTINSGAITSSGQLELQASTPSIHFLDTDDNSDGYIQANAGTLRFYADDANEVGGSIITFNIDGSEKLRLNNAGQLGVGVSPSYPLEVAGAGTVSIAYQRTGVSAKKWGFHSDNDATYWQNITDNTLPLTIKNGGNVGIGDTAPPSTLTVLGDNSADVASVAAGINGLQITRTTGSGENLYAYIGNGSLTGWSGSTFPARIESFGCNVLEIGSQQSVPISFGTNNTERMRIDSSGNTVFKPTGSEVGRVTSSGFTTTGSYSATGNFNTSLGGYQINGTTVIDSSSNITTSGVVTINGAGAKNALVLSGTSPTMLFKDTTSGHDHFWLHANSNNFYILADRDSANAAYGAWETPHPLQLEADTNKGYLFGNEILYDGANISVGTISSGDISITKDGNASISLQDTGHGFGGSSLTLENGGRDLRMTVPQDIIFDTGNEVMRIDKDDRVLIGKSSADNTSVGFRFDSATGFSSFVRDGGEPLYLNRKTSDGDVVKIAKDGTVVGVIGTQNWGIGTSSPDEKLHVHASDSGNSLAAFTNSTTGLTTEFVVGINSSEQALLYNENNTDMLFATNDTERMRIDSSGRVGIGETDPDRQLHLTNSSLALAKIESTAAQYAGIDFKNTSRLWYAGIRVELGHGFGIKDEDANRVRLAIDTSGNVDIPQGNFEIGGQTVITSARNIENISQITASGQISGGTLKTDNTHDGFFGGASFSWGGNSGYPTLYGSHADRWVMMAFPHVTYLQNGTNGHTGSTTGATMRMAANPSASAYWDVGIGSTTDLFRIGRQGVNALAIDSSGRVGIGTDSPSQQLHLYKSTNEAGLKIQSGGNGNVTWGIFSNPTWATDTLQIYNHTADSSKVTIKASGEVGIGTASPDEKLDVEGNLRLESSSSNGTYLALRNSATNGRNYRIGSNFVTGAGELAIYDDVAGAERMRITSGGTVGIATTSPSASYKLDVNGKIRSQQEMLINTGSLFVNQEGEGIHLLSPNGTEYKITVDNSGNLVATEQ